jgi:hypothetical protein
MIAALMVATLTLALGTPVTAHAGPPTRRWPSCGRWIAVPTPGSWTPLQDVAVISPTDAWTVGFAEFAPRRRRRDAQDGWRWFTARIPTIREGTD